MKQEIINRILRLRIKSQTEVDHLSILQELYDEFQNGNKEFYLLARFFTNGMDDLPTLKQKHEWNKESFVKHRKLFFENHDILVEIINTYFDLNDNQVLKQEFHENENLKIIWIERNGKKDGIFRRYFEDNQIAYESNYEMGVNIHTTTEWYENGQVAEIGSTTQNEYIVEQFWDRDGNQIL
ncbi:MAG: antitoxin component YwqK of YwqJK toxin-antitoxin module [Saprospiraceae bacterium]|jgi:antitoxin component YwqK of YwqJK toxin-antitoxin module|tara:strand:+ start:741 stop:1286 length:546 start_codon:yes stop_codon:yes gene_type:complete